MNKALTFFLYSSKLSIKYTKNIAKKNNCNEFKLTIIIWDDIRFYSAYLVER